MTNKKILLIEDDEQMAELLERFSVEQKLQVAQVTRPSQAITLLEVEKFDLIILDLSLPEMDGLDLCLKIREITDIYIIISSARSDLDDKLVGFENGADDYLPKPYLPRELLARIKSVFKRDTGLKNDEEESPQRRFVDVSKYFNTYERDLTQHGLEGMGLGLYIVEGIVNRHDYALLYEFTEGMHSFSIKFG